MSAESGRGSLVKVAFARNQAEAELIQGLLGEVDVPSVLKRSRGFDVPDFLASGPRDVFVAESDVEVAREALEGTATETEGEERAELSGQAALERGPAGTSPARLLAWILIALLVGLLVAWALYQAG